MNNWPPGLLARHAAIALLTWAVATPALVLAQSPAGSSVTPSASTGMANQPAEARGEPVAGLWPSPKLLRSLLVRRADDVARQLDLDDAQRSSFRESFVQRWERFLTTRHDEVRPLLNEFLEMRMDVEPPTAEQARSWAERCAPVFDDVREEVSAGNDELRKLLTPGQRVRFEMEAAKWSVGLELAEERIRRWRRGEGDPVELWHDPDKAKRRRSGDHRPGDAAGGDSGQNRERPSSDDAEVDQIAVELQRWDQWLVTFMDDHAMDPGQRDAARSMLDEMKQRAIDHRDRNREGIARLESLIAGADAQAVDLEDMKRRLVELYGPVDRMFAELKTRVETLLTSEQRALARSGGKPNPTVAETARSRSSRSETDAARSNGNKPAKDPSNSDTATNRPIETP